MQGKTLILLFCLSCTTTVFAQPFTHADSLRGTITAERAWWDLNFYDLEVTPNITEETISGKNTIYFTSLTPGKTMQIDLQAPLAITKALYHNKEITWKQEGNAWYLQLPEMIGKGKKESVTVYYSGKPVKAKRAPWDGGLVWAKDEKKRPFVNTACQGLGASVWWPTKDHQYDEVDSMRFTVHVPDTLYEVSNGRLRSLKKDGKGMASYEWFISNPINNYAVAMNIGKYVHFKDTMMGEKGLLTLDFYVLDYNLEKAQKQFVQAKQMLRAFEYWLGPYPFYSDGFKLVESDHLGMEHQSATAYGNRYRNGYRGTDLSGSGWGLKWDFIIIHESGHEWFGNNITSKDIADMWVHEGFTNYTETLFTGYYYGEKAADEYNRGTRRNIQNDRPVIGSYNVNSQGSGDMYSKGGNMLHTIRKTINNDEKFRQILRGLGKDFYHKTVTSKDVEQYISQKSGIDFSKVFDQYLRNTGIPQLSYTTTIKNGSTQFNVKWDNCVSGFNLPVYIRTDSDNSVLAKPNDKGYITVNTKSNETDLSKLIDPALYIKIVKK